jgi:dTMP kinase
LFVSFEGPEGSGKSTQVERLRRRLEDRDPVVVREPGGTPLGERIRELLLGTAETMSGDAEMYLFMAARAQLVTTVISPALAQGKVVLADRYHDSTLAYQGGGRGVDTVWPGAFPRPDMTFLLALPAEEGLRRQARAKKGADRLESESEQFHGRVNEAYERLAAEEPARWVRIDATQSADEVEREVLACLTPRLRAAGR